MPKASTPSFIHELPLVVDSKQAAILESRFEAGRNLLNACLDKGMERVRLLRESQAHQDAKKMPKGKARTEAFAAARRAYRYSEYDLQAYANQVAEKSKWIKRHLDVHAIQKIASRAFTATEKVLFGGARSVRFKSRSQFASIEGKSNATGIRWRGDRVEWNTKQHKLTLKAIINWTDEVTYHSLSCKVKYSRIVRRVLNGKTRYFVQMICEGLPHQKPQNTLGAGTVGIDLGVSSVAIVGDDQALLLPFVPEIDSKHKEIRRLQRQLERSRRAKNPDNYEPDFKDVKGRKKKGKSKKGRRKWNNSNRYQKTRRKLAEIKRKQVAQRKSLQRNLANRVVRMGCYFQMEKVSVKGWQKLFGKSVCYKAPSLFQSELVLKAERAGGQVNQFPTTTTALSQTCICGRKKKKPLRQRVHDCECGAIMQRDLMSGYLAAARCRLPVPGRRVTQPVR